MVAIHGESFVHGVYRIGGPQSLMESPVSGRDKRLSLVSKSESKNPMNASANTRMGCRKCQPYRYGIHALWWWIIQLQLNSSSQKNTYCFGSYWLNRRAALRASLPQRFYEGMGAVAVSDSAFAACSGDTEWCVP